MTEIFPRLLKLSILPLLLGVIGPPLPAPQSGPPARQWDRQSARELLAYIETVDREGLNAVDYAPSALRLAVDGNDASQMETAATRSFGLLARDLARGHLLPGRRGRVFITSDPLEPATVAELIDGALARRNVVAVLDGLVPRDSQYIALKSALARLPKGDSPQRTAIRVNLERLRWLPRNPGADRLVVNIPEYHVHLFRGGQQVSSFRVIVGKPSTPTPQFSAQVTGIILNPPWRVPQSIIAESVGKLVRTRPSIARARGYTWTYSAGHLQVTQQPGPQNSLGQVKLDMPNPFAVYLHDTPSKALFDKDKRTFSHGCIRTDHPLDLAAALLGAAGPDRPEMDRITESRVTQRFALSRPLPIYVLYQTVIATPDGSVRYLEDPYHLDSLVAAQLDNGRLASSSLMTLTECSQV